MRLYEQPAHVLHDMLVNKEITSVELTKDVLARIDEVEGEVKAYLTITRDEALQQAAGDVRLDAVVADPSVAADRETLRIAAQSVGAELVVATVSTRSNPGQHDPLRLAAALQDLFSGR